MGSLMRDPSPEELPKHRGRRRDEALRKKNTYGGGPQSKPPSSPRLVVPPFSSDQASQVPAMERLRSVTNVKTVRFAEPGQTSPHISFTFK